MSMRFASSMLFGVAVCMAAPAIAQTAACAVPIPGNALPDLTVDPVRLAADVSVTEERFNKTSCDVVEGFVTGAGRHTLLRFTSSTPNLGGGDLVIGAPAACPGLFELSTCHGHYHFHKYADYRLWTENGWTQWVAARNLAISTEQGTNASFLANALASGALLTGRKMGFCMIDSARYSAAGQSAPRYVDCNVDQGLSVGWTDIYGARLSGQYVEIDRLPDGTYVLEVHVNAEHLLPEASTINNSSAVRIRYTARRGSRPPAVEVLGQVF